MILAISRFEVANGMVDEVRRAFLDRPKLVEGEPGFLGFEVFVDSAEPAAFHLVTRWTDEDAYRRWHASPAHDASHVGIPAGLRLDPSQTRLELLERIDEDDELERAVRDSGNVLTAFFARADSVHVVMLDRRGNIRWCNEALPRMLAVPRQNLLGHPLADFLVEQDRPSLQSRMEESRRFEDPLRLNLVPQNQKPYSLDCHVDRQGDKILIVGEIATEDRLHGELMDQNAELATLVRENARQRRELARANEALQVALDDLNTSYWHLEKIQELLPICMSCHEVKTAEGEWTSVVEYLQKHSLFLSHGYCPECAAKVRADLQPSSLLRAKEKT